MCRVFVYIHCGITQEMAPRFKQTTHCCQSNKQYVIVTDDLNGVRVSFASFRLCFHC